MYSERSPTNLHKPIVKNTRADINTAPVFFILNFIAAHKCRKSEYSKTANLKHIFEKRFSTARQTLCHVGLLLGVYILLSRRITYTHPFPDRGQLRLFQALQGAEGSLEPFMQAGTFFTASPFQILHLEFFPQAEHQQPLRVSI